MNSSHDITSVSVIDSPAGRIDTVLRAMEGAIDLSFVLGADAGAVHCLGAGSGSGSQRIVYMCGNVGVIYDTGSKSQQLLRGHVSVALQRSSSSTNAPSALQPIRSYLLTSSFPSHFILQRNPLTACVLSRDASAIATACSGAESSIIFWTAEGVPIGMIEQPHAGGTAAMAFSPCGSYLATLSVAHASEESEELVQELGLWNIGSIVAPSSSSAAAAAEADAAPTAQLLVSAVVPVRDAQHDVKFNPAAAAPAFQLVSTGSHSVVFWAASKRVESIAPIAAHGSGRLIRSRDVWGLSCNAPRVPPAPLPANAPPPKAGQTAVVPPRVLTASTFITGSLAAPMSTVDDAVMEMTGHLTNLLAGTSAAVTLATVTGTGGRGGPAGPRAGAAAKDAQKTLLSAPTAAIITAVTATEDGVLLLWTVDAESKHLRCIKAVKLAVGGAETEGEGAGSGRVNCVSVSPAGTHLVVGTESGCVRTYDLSLRLLSWFDGLGCGPVTGLCFVPGTGADKPRPPVGPHGAPAPAAAADIPDLYVVTRRSMIVSLRASLFDTLTEEERRGTVIVEGPDSAVTGLAAYPNAPRLAVAIASGCVQVWDSDSHQLLVIRELPRPKDADPYAPPAPTTLYVPSALAVDPRARLMAVGTTDGYIFLLRLDDLSDAQEPLKPAHWPHAGAEITCLCFSADGYHLAASDAERHVALFRFCKTTQRRLAPSAASAAARTTVGSKKPWEAVTSEADKYEEVVGDEWVYIGRAQSHSQGVTGLSFSLPAGATAKPVAHGWPEPTFWAPEHIHSDAACIAAHARAGLCQLVSVGADKRMVLYDVGSSSIAGGLRVRLPGHRLRVERFAAPSACGWLPEGSVGSSSDGEASVVVATDGFKFRNWAVTSSSAADAGAAAAATPSLKCTRTALAPTFGGAVTHMCFLAAPTEVVAAEESKSSDSKHSGSSSGSGSSRCVAMAYATDDRVVGVAALPLDGNPYSVVGVVGHTGPVSGLAASFDGRHIFTSGGDSASGCGSVCVWRVRQDVLLHSKAAGGSGVIPFLSLLEGGADGAQYQSICDLFSYAQIHSQGEASTAPRRAGSTLPTAELPALMRGLGFYPTTEEVEIMLAEARSLQAGSSGGSSGGGDVDLATVIRLFVNHRPVVAVGREEIARAFATVAGSREVEVDAEDAGGVRWGALLDLLEQRGDSISGEEIAAAIMEAARTRADGSTGEAPPSGELDEEAVVNGELFAQLFGV